MSTMGESWLRKLCRLAGALTVALWLVNRDAPTGLAQEAAAREEAPVLRREIQPAAEAFSDVVPPGSVEETDEAEEKTDFIETDRNSFTFSRITPGRERLIVESAYSYIHIGSEGAKHSFPELLFRYGLGDRIELRLGWNFETGRSPSEAPEGDLVNYFGANAEQQIYYGLKYQVTRKKGFRPDSAVLVQGHTPTGGPQSISQIRLGYVWGWTLPNHWNFDSAVRFGTDKEGSDGYSLWAPSAVLKIPFGPRERWFTQVENFGIMSHGKEKEFSKQFVDTGLHYLVTPNLEVGTVVAFGINDQSRGIFVNTGVGIRF
jgi:Putative MetA-pathway of phenol degradation